MLHWSYNLKRYIINDDSAILTISYIGILLLRRAGYTDARHFDTASRRGTVPERGPRVTLKRISAENSTSWLFPSSTLLVALRLIIVRLVYSSQSPFSIADIITTSERALQRALQLENQWPLSRRNGIARCDVSLNVTNAETA